MLKNIDLTREVPKAEYKVLKADADLKLAALQRQAKACPYWSAYIRRFLRIWTYGFLSKMSDSLDLKQFAV